MTNCFRYKLIGILFSCLFLACTINDKLFSQNVNQNFVDSIYNKALKERNDTLKLTSIFSECTKALKKRPIEVRALLNKSLKISATCSDKKWIAKNKSLLGTTEYTSGNFEQGEKLFKEALEYYAISGNKNGQAVMYNNLANLYRDKGEYKIAVDYYLKSLKLKEEIKDKKGIISTLNNLANLHTLQSDMKGAEKYYVQALKIAEETKNPESLSMTYSNLANIYFDLEEYDKSYQYDSLALYYRKKTDNKAGIAISLHNIASYYNAKKKYEKALEYINEALTIKAELGDKQGTAVSLSEKGTIMQNMGLPDSAIIYFHKALDIATSISTKQRIAVCYYNLGKAYNTIGKFEKAYDYQKKYSDLRDTLSKESLEKNITEMETKYDTDKKKKEIELLTKEAKLNLMVMREKELESESKAKEIELLNKENELAEIQNQKSKFELASNQKEISLLNQKEEIKDLEIKNNQAAIKQQRTIVIFSILALSIVSILAFFIFKGLKKQKKANRLISKQKEQVEEKNVQIHHQKELLEEKQKEILDSIHYAKRIQNTIIANKEFIDQHIENNFIYFNPKDIVSGDFYWATKKDDFFFLAVCDSTGHGVPGAFMSLLNIGFLSEAINEKDIVEPSKIFDYTRERLINSISKEGQKDGFDGILIRINLQSKEIIYVAANNNPVLISGSEVHHLHVDKMPVGHGERKDSFQQYQIEYNKGDLLYLYTDGYADQFGGPKGKKFKYKQLDELLIRNSPLNLEEQKNGLTETFDGWRGDLEQVDDVCIIGIRL